MIDLDPQHSTGDVYIDQEHALLLQLIAKVSASLKADAPNTSLVRLLHDVQQYAEYHFASEENYMADIDYPMRAEHARIHTEMLRALSLLIARATASQSVGPELREFLMDWVHEHIVDEDTKLAQFATDQR